jgi:predicted O-methyltransferase YrrM
MLQKVNSWLGQTLAGALPQDAVRSFISTVGKQRPSEILESFGPLLNRSRYLDNAPFDLEPVNGFQFEHLAGLFASTSLDHAVIGMTVRQAAYVFGLIRQTKAQRVLEIGRNKGGGTLLMAAAMQGHGQLWSIDIGEKEARMRGGGRPYDRQLEDVLASAGLRATLLVGDSHTIEVDTGELDVAYIDGDHSYEGVRNDFERFGRRVRVGGAVLFDDAHFEGLFGTHDDTVGRLVDEVVAAGRFRLVKNVNRLAHIERTQAD